MADKRKNSTQTKKRYFSLFLLAISGTLWLCTPFAADAKLANGILQT